MSRPFGTITHKGMSMRIALLHGYYWLDWLGSKEMRTNRKVDEAWLGVCYHAAKIAVDCFREYGIRFPDNKNCYRWPTLAMYLRNRYHRVHNPKEVLDAIEELRKTGEVQDLMLVYRTYLRAIGLPDDP